MLEAEEKRIQERFTLRSKTLEELFTGRSLSMEFTGATVNLEEVHPAVFNSGLERFAELKEPSLSYVVTTSIPDFGIKERILYNQWGEGDGRSLMITWTSSGPLVDDIRLIVEILEAARRGIHEERFFSGYCGFYRFLGELSRHIQEKYLSVINDSSDGD